MVTQWNEDRHTSNKACVDRMKCDSSLGWLREHGYAGGEMRNQETSRHRKNVRGSFESI